MRIDPLVCWGCSNWFIPKTKHKTKFCCGACKQQYHLIKTGKKTREKNLSLEWHSKVEGRDIWTRCTGFCKHNNHPTCIECVFNKEFEEYKILIKKYGVDKNGKNESEWLDTDYKVSLPGHQK